MSAKRGPGRPKLPKGEAHAKAFTTKLSATELRAVKAAAERAGKPASEWAREGLLRLADNQRQDEQS